MHKNVINKALLCYSVLLFFLVLTSSCGSQDKKDAADFFLKGNVALSQKNYAEALRLYDEAIAKNEEFSDAYLNKAISLSKLNRLADAYEILTEALTIDPTLAQANLVRAEIGLDLGKLREARADLQQIEKQYKDSTRFYLVRGNLRQSESNTSQALADYDQALKLDIRNMEAYVNRGAIYYQMQKLDLAETDFKSALVLEKAQPQALNNLGLIETKREHWDSALSYFDQVLGKNPADALAQNNKAFVLLHQGKNKEAFDLIHSSLEILPENGYALRNLGMYYEKISDAANALLYYNKAIDLAQPVDLLYGLTGQVYYQMGKKNDACATWRKGVILKDSLAAAALMQYCQ